MYYPYAFGGQSNEQQSTGFGEPTTGFFDARKPDGCGRQLIGVRASFLGPVRQ